MRALLLVLILAAGVGIYLNLSDSGPSGGKPQARPGAPTEKKHPDSYLSAEGRRRLMDLERADLLLSRALAPFLRALKACDAAAIRSATAKEFRSALPELPDGFEHAGRRRAYGWTALRTEAVGDAQDLVAWAQSLRDRFDSLDTVSFSRKRNGAEILEQRETVTESSGVFRFAGTRKGGGRLELSGRFALRHAALGGYSGEGPVSAWIHELRLTDTVVAHADAPLFAEITKDCGIDVKSLHDNWLHREKASYVFTGGLYLGDVNRDGILDLMVAERGHSTWLYLGVGNGTFRDSGWRPMADGNEPQYVAIFDATGDGHIEVLHGGTLHRWSTEHSTLEPIRDATQLPSADTVLCDYDRDGLTDVFFIFAGELPSTRPSRAFFDNDRITGRANLLYRNLGGGRFKDVTHAAGASGKFGRTFAAAWFYANDDPWPDLFCANEFGRNTFLVNKGDGTFDDHEDIDPRFGGFSMGISTGDLDGDGRADLYVSNMYSKAGHRVYHHLDLDLYPESVRQMFMASIEGNRYYRSRGDLGFDERSTKTGVNAVGWGWSGGIADFNLDGWLDIYAPCGHTSVDRDKPDG